MNLFNCLAVYEFSKYSSCFEVLNTINKSSLIQVLEISPTPSGGILILVAASSDELDLFYLNSLGEFKKRLIDSSFIRNLKTDVVSAYLSQNSSSEITNLNFYETNSLCGAFVYCQKIAESGAHIIDFRVLRSIHNRAIIVYSGNTLDQKSYTIDKPNETVRGYFEVSK